MEIWDFNIRHLRAVAKIAELGTMNAAAQAVNLTQPAITQALARIESLLGLPLFERRHNGMAPTAAAELFVPRVQAALDHISSPHVTMSRMRALLSLADSGSYNGASALTGLSLPSLHRAVSDLALSSRRPLAERRGKIVILTEAGEAMARAFRLARVEIEAGLAEIAAMRGHETRRIAIGAMPLSRARVMPAAVARFLRRHPQVRVSIVEGSRAELVEPLRNGAIDLAIGAMPLSRARVMPAAVARFLRRHPQVRVSIVEGSRAELVEPLRNGAIDLMIGAMREPLTEPDLIQQTLFRDRLVAIGRKNHPLTGSSPSVADLAAFPWIVSGEGTPLRLLWEQMFRREGLSPPPVPVESGSVMTIRQLLLDGDFLTLLSPDQVSVELEADWLVKVADLPDDLDRTIAVTTRSSWRPTAVQAQFLDDLKAVSQG